MSGQMMARLDDGRRADLKDGGGGTRKDYGPKGVCGPIVLGVPVVAVVALLAKAVRR
jgi:hypothetical protein